MTPLDSIRGLRFGPLGAGAVHVCVDMQRLFAEPGEWHAPSLDGIVPAVARLAAHRPERTLFTRFLTPATVEEARGQWQAYYRRWGSVLASRNEPDVFGLVAPLRRFVPPGRLVDKLGHSAFSAPAFATELERLAADTLLLTGVETEVCVLATVLEAIDRGFRIVLVEDALSSSSEAGHRAALEAIYPRYDQQVEVVRLAEALAAWTH